MGAPYRRSRSCDAARLGGPVLEWFFRKRAREQEIESELKYHLEMLHREGIEQGLSSADAATAAHRKLGNATSVRETVSEIWGLPWLEAVGKDARYAIRTLRRSPLLMFAALLSLALGIGMTTAIFTLVNSILLRPLPYKDPGRLVMIWTDDPRHDVHEEGVSYP